MFELLQIFGVVFGLIMGSLVFLLIGLLVNNALTYHEEWAALFTVFWLSFYLAIIIKLYTWGLRP